MVGLIRDGILKPDPSPTEEEIESKVFFTVGKIPKRWAFGYKATATSTQLFGSLLLPENEMFSFKPKEHLA